MSINARRPKPATANPPHVLDDRSLAIWATSLASSLGLAVHIHQLPPGQYRDAVRLSITSPPTLLIATSRTGVAAALTSFLFMQRAHADSVV